MLVQWKEILSPKQIKKKLIETFQGCNNQKITIEMLELGREFIQPFISKIAEHAILYDRIEILDWIYVNRFDIGLDSNLLECFVISGSHSNHLLDWIITHAPLEKIAYDHSVVDYASIDKNIFFLDWFIEQVKCGNFELKYTNYAIDGAISSSCITILDWWLKQQKTNNIEFKYSERAIDTASMCGYMHVVEWFANNLPLENLKFTNKIFDTRNLEVIQWWKNFFNKIGKDCPLDLKIEN